MVSCNMYIRNVTPQYVLQLTMVNHIKSLTQKILASEKWDILTKEAKWKIGDPSRAFQTMH